MHDDGKKIGGRIKLKVRVTGFLSLWNIGVKIQVKVKVPALIELVYLPVETKRL